MASAINGTNTEVNPVTTTVPAKAALESAVGTHLSTQFIQIIFSYLIRPYPASLKSRTITAMDGNDRLHGCDFQRTDKGKLQLISYVSQNGRGTKVVAHDLEDETAPISFLISGCGLVYSHMHIAINGEEETFLYYPWPKQRILRFGDHEPFFRDFDHTYSEATLTYEHRADCAVCVQESRVRILMRDDEFITFDMGFHPLLMTAHNEKQFLFVSKSYIGVIDYDSNKPQGIHVDMNNCLATLNPSRKTLFVLDGNSTVSSYKIVPSLSNSGSFVIDPASAISANSTSLASLSENCVSLWDVNTGQKELTFPPKRPEHPYERSTIALSEQFIAIKFEDISSDKSTPQVDVYDLRMPLDTKPAKASDPAH